MRQMNINKGNYEVKSHYKMYKAGKRWVVAGMATVSLLGGLLMLSTDASADNVDAVVPASESSVTTQVSTPTDSVVLDHASASVAPASSVSAEVSASSASSVAPVSVSTAASVVSADASLSASQSLASSFVVPAEAVKVQDDLDSDGNVRKAYALADAQGATMTQMPHLDSAGTIADVSVSNVASVSASNAALFSDKGSAQVSQDFKNTGDAASFSNVPTNNLDLNKQLSDSASSLFGAKNIFNNPGTVGNADSYASMGVDSIVNSMYGLVYTNTYYTVSASLSAAKKSSDASAILSAVKSSVRESISPAYTSYFKSIYADAGSALSNIINQTNAIPDVNTLPVKDANLGDKIHWTNLVPSIRNEAGTLSFNSQMDMNKYFIIQGGYRMVNVLDGQVLKEKATGGQAIGLAMLPVSPDKMGTVDALKAGVAKTLNVNDAILNMPNGVFAGHDLYVTGTGDVNTKLAHIRTTDATGALGTATYDTTKSVTSPLQGGTNISTDTTSFASNELSNGVFFTVIWNPASSQDGKATGTLTYVEYNSFADMTADASSLVKTISAKPTHASGFVQSTLTLDDAMAVGLYGTNGGNASAMFGGISYFEGTHAVATVNVSYTFNDVKILPDTTINAVAGESIQIKNGKQDDDSKMVKGYDAPTGQGFAISADSKLSVVASDDAQLVVKYVVDKQGFQQNVETATKLAGKIKDQITTAEAQRDAAPEKDKAVIQIAIDHMQAELNNLQGEDGKSGLIGTLMNATSDSTLDDLKTVDAVVGQYNSVQTQMTDITALGDRVSKLVNAVDALLDKEDADANAARDAAKLLGDSAEKSVAKSNKQFSDKVQKAQTDLDTTMADPNSKASDIEHATAVLLADVESESVEHGTDGNVQELLKKVEQAVANGTTDEINEATAKLKIADATVVPANIADNTDVAAAKTAVDKALATSPLDQKQLNESKANYDKAVSKANEALKDAKDAAGTTEENLKHADADTVSKMKKVVDTAVATGTKTDIEKAVANLKVADDTAVVPSTLSDDPALKTAKQAINNAIQSDTFNQTKLNEAKTAYDKALSDAEGTLLTAKEVAGNAKKAIVNGGNQDVADHEAAVDEAVENGTASDIAKAVAKLQIADATVVPTNVSDDDVVKAAKKAVDDALKNDVDVTTAEAAYGKAVEQANKKLDGAKQNANDDMSAWNKDVSLYADQDTNDIQKDVAKLNELVGDKTATKSKIDDAREQLRKDIAVVSGARGEKVNEGNAVAKDNEANSDDEVKLTVDNLKKAIATGTKTVIDEAINKVKTAVDTIVAVNISDSDDVKAAKTAVNDILNATGLNADELTKAVAKLTDTVVSAKKDLQATKDGAANDENSWTADKTKYADQTTTDVEGAIKHLDELTSNDNSKKSDIEAARNDLQAAIKKVAAVRQKAVDNADAVVVKNGENTDVKKRVAAVKTAENTGTASDIAKAIAKLQTADATVVPTNIADDGDVAAAKVAVNKALNANDYKQADVDTAKQVYDNAVATAQATLKQAVTDANAVKVPANLQDQVEMAKKNKLGDVDQQVTDLHKAAGQDDTTASTLRSAMNDIQGSLDDMTTKLHTTRDAAQKLVDQTADATDTNVVAARKQVTNLLANNDTTTMTDLQNAMNVLTAMSKPATANTVETSSATVESDQVSTPVANGDAAFAIVTDANGKQTVVQLDKTENGTATANVPGATDAQVVTVPKNGNKPFIFVTDGSGTAQYTELTPNGVKTTITPDGTSTKTTDGKTLDVPADGDVTVMYLPTAEVSVQAGAKNVQVPGKTGYTATVTDAQGNEVTLTDGMIAVDGVPAGTNYLVTYTPDPAKVVMKLGTDSGFAKGEEPAAGNTNAQTLMTVQDALNKLQKDDATLAAIVSTGYTDTKVNVTNAVEALNRVDQNLNIDGYAHRIQAPDGTQYNSLEDAVKANPTFAAGTTQMKVVYAPLDGQKIQVKDADGNVLGTVMGKSDAEINVDDFKSVDADLQAKAEKGKLKMTVTAPDGKTYDSLMDALQATGYFDHVGLEDGPSSFDQSDAKFVATAWDETGKATAGYMVLGEPATPNDLNIQDFVVSFAPANDGAGHNNTNAGSKTGSSVAANNQNGDQVNVAGPANESRDGSEVNNATVAGQASGAQVAGSQIDATANTAQNAGWQAQGATQNSDNTASLLAAAGNEQQANTVNSDDARIIEMPDSAAVIQDSILPLESAKQAMNLTGRVTEDNFLVVVAAMVASGLFGLLLAFWRRRKEDDQATR